MAIAPPGTYTTAQVLEMTGISRYTLQRFLKQSRFPKPVNRSKGSGSANFFCREEVDQWVSERTADLPVNTQPLNGEVQITLTFTKREMSAHKRACAELHCDFEAYAFDAIRWKTRAVLPETGYIRPNINPNLKLVA